MTRTFLLIFLPFCYSTQNCPRPEQLKPLTEAQQWALGASGMLATRNHMKFDSLAGDNINMFSIQTEKSLLKDALITKL